MMNPAGVDAKIRIDRRGDGRYGSPRGHGHHEGVDYEIKPGDPVYMPFDGTIVRVARPYSDAAHYSGLLVMNESMFMKIFYFQPLPFKRGRGVKEGTVIGCAQDISKRYPPDENNRNAMNPHIHVEINTNPEFVFKANGLIDELAGLFGAYA